MFPTLSDFRAPGAESERQALLAGELVAGKIAGIYEQEISTDATNEGIGRALRRYSDWVRIKE